MWDYMLTIDGFELFDDEGDLVAAVVTEGDPASDSMAAQAICARHNAVVREESASERVLEGAR